jgi:hypothetical protein
MERDSPARNAASFQEEALQFAHISALSSLTEKHRCVCACVHVNCGHCVIPFRVKVLIMTLDQCHFVSHICNLTDCKVVWLTTCIIVIAEAWMVFYKHMEEWLDLRPDQGAMRWKRTSRIKMRIRFFSASPIGVIAVYNNRHFFTMLSSVISITFDIRSLFSEKCS